MRHNQFALFSAACLCGLLLIANVAMAADTMLSSGVDRAGFDNSIKPGDDFFRYVNGTWIKHNPIPPEYGRWGSFFKLRDVNLLALREILDDLAKTDKKLDGNRAKLRNFYRTAMDEARLEELGVSPLADELERIAKIKDRDGLVAELGRQRAGGRAALFM